jgi:hypothetical protein
VFPDTIGDHFNNRLMLSKACVTTYHIPVSGSSYAPHRRKIVGRELGELTAHQENHQCVR